MRFVKRHKILAVVLGLLALLFVLSLIFISPFVYSFIRNEITLRNFARPFLEYPLPPQTTEISNSGRWGVLTGAGNHCDFEVSRTLRTELSQPEIKAYYANVEYLPIVPGKSAFEAIWGRNGMLGVDVEFDPTQSAIVTVSIFDGIYSGSIWDFACS
ncbi:MAG: hypothetical protein U0452_08550 [Anaerolineae bacterium]